MKRLSFYLSAALLLATLAACSKKEAAAVPQASSDPVPAQQTGGDSADKIVQLQNQVGTALERKNYTAAADALAQVSPSSQTLSDAQRIQYMQQLRQTMDMLARAAETDPAAKAAYERLGQVATGR
jgi:outer membrane biosynthesis protein TonB